MSWHVNVDVAYHSKKLYGKLNTMVEGNHEEKDNGATTQELSALVKAIESGNLHLLESLLNAASDKNISDRLVSSTLPKRWHHVAKTITSTPLRVSVSWRNSKALDMILKSKCIVTHEDVSKGLQKVLRQVEGDTEMEFISTLVKHGAIVESPHHFSQAFKKLLYEGHINRCQQIVHTICQPHVPNALVGLMLLAVAQPFSKPHNGNVNEDIDETVFMEQQTALSRRSMRSVFATRFSPTEFIKDTKVWVSFGGTDFQRLLFALPLLIQTMPRCPVEAIGWILRRISRYYALTNAEGKDKVRQLPRLMFEAGMNIPKIMSVACLSPRFVQDTGFSRWTALHKTRVRSLQQHCRVVIRNFTTSGNVYRAMQTTTCFPTVMKDFLLLTDVQALPWEQN